MQYFRLASSLIMENKLGLLIFSGIATGAMVAYMLWKRRREEKWKEVATVDKLYVHPVKSCRGMLVDSFDVTENGIMVCGTEIGDRTFMMVYENGRFGTIRQFPRLVLIQPSVIGPNRLRLVAPDMDPIELDIPNHGSEKVFEYKVWNSRCQGMDCGDEVAAWLQKFLGANNARLVFHNQRLPHRERLDLMGFGHLGVYVKGPLKSVFHDAAPFNMLSQASIDSLNTKLDPGHKVTERWFRTNVLLTGCEAFAEDSWKRVKVGSAEFLFAKYTTRCKVTTVNPENGIADPEKTTLTTLSSFRSTTAEEKKLFGDTPKFCVDFVVTKEGRINLGDKVFVSVRD